MKKAAMILPLFALVMLPLWTFPGHAFGGSATLTWQPNNEPDLAEYRVYYGTASRSYGTPISVGKSTSYTVTGLQEGKTYYFALTAVDTAGNESGYSAEASKTIPVSPPGPPPTSEPQMEVGTASIDHNWTRVNFAQPFNNPIVIAKPLSTNGADPSTVRIKNLNSNGFDIRLQEWKYLNQTHVKEEVSYLVMEKGHYLLPDGREVEAGIVTTNRADISSPPEQIGFFSPFGTIPVVSTCVLTSNDATPVITRNRGVSKDRFEFILQEEENNDRSHGTETVGYIAWEAGKGRISGFDYEVGLIGNVNSNWKTAGYGPFQSSPYLIMDMQTTVGADPANVRLKQKTAHSVRLMVHEEKSKDAEMIHTYEVIGYFALR